MAGEALAPPPFPVFLRAIDILSLWVLEDYSSHCSSTTSGIIGGNRCEELSIQWKHFLACCHFKMCLF